MNFLIIIILKSIPSNKSIRGPRMLSAAAATSDLEMA